MNEKFLAGLKAAIEYGKDTDWGYNREDEYAFDTFNSDEALAAVVKFLEESSPWIPIEEVELVDGEMYDTYSMEYGRIPDCRFNINHLDGNDKWFKSRFLLPNLYINQVTHIMKRPADPVI